MSANQYNENDNNKIVKSDLFANDLFLFANDMFLFGNDMLLV